MLWSLLMMAPRGMPGPFFHLTVIEMDNGDHDMTCVLIMHFTLGENWSLPSDMHTFVAHLGNWTCDLDPPDMHTCVAFLGIWTYGLYPPMATGWSTLAYGSAAQPPWHLGNWAFAPRVHRYILHHGT